MTEKPVVPLAEIVQPLLPVGAYAKTVPGALAVAGEEETAFPALTGERTQLVASEFQLRRAVHHLHYGAVTEKGEMVLLKKLCREMPSIPSRRASADAFRDF